MKTLRLAVIALFAFLTICFASCNKNNNGSTNDEIIEYQGEYPVPENIEYVEDGVTYKIEAIPGQVVISTDEDYNTVVDAVTAHEGKIIEQYPQYGLYTVEVVVGNENAFVAAMNDLNISSELNLVEYPKERYDYFVFDDYVDANGVQHGRKVSNILSECQNDAVINEVNNVVKLTIPVTIPSPIPIVYLYATTLNYTNFLLWDKLLSQDMVLVNWSHGYGGHSDDWQNMTLEEKSSFKIGWKKEVMRKLDQIIRLKKKNPNIDIVFAKAAGNERCPELSQMINDIKANPKYKKVLEENFILVSDYSSFANTSSSYGDFCYIKEHPYFAPGPNGGSTSFAPPQALCYINQVIKGTIGEDGKNITAVQALAAVKAAIRQNSNGELDLDEALAMARSMYSPGFFTGTPFDNTSWNVPYTTERNATGIRRVSESHHGSNGVYYTYHNENFSETDNNNEIGMFSFKNNIFMIGGAPIEFKGDSIFVPGLGWSLNDEPIIYDQVIYNPEKVTYSRYFTNNNTFCFRIIFESTYTSELSGLSGPDDWFKSHSVDVNLYEFTINESTNNCTFDYNYTGTYSILEHGSAYTGVLSKNSTIIGHGSGTYEYGVKDNNVKQVDNSNDLMFIPGIPMKKHK